VVNAGCMAFLEDSRPRLKSQNRNGRDGRLLKLKILSNWKEYLKKVVVKLNTAIEKRLCITVPEAAEMLGISRNFAYELVKRGELPSIKFGKRKLIPKLALEKRLEEAK
jgi:excisionase family DNA binding protein